MENELVRYSRAGDAFHYRWAARRCLRMIYPGSSLRYVVIEGSGSTERELAGEYVIDVAEYSGAPEADLLDVAYFQLKHTSVRKERPFNLSNLRMTITGFAERYREQMRRNRDARALPRVTFTIVTNRPIAERVKQQFALIAKGGRLNARFQKALGGHIKLDGKELADFCGLLHFVDGEGDYDAQRHELHAEIAQLLAGTVDNTQIDTIAALVQERALRNVSRGFGHPFSEFSVARQCRPSLPPPVPGG